jgi:hypothetical protein
MPWCPKCKTEYEEHIQDCADCEIPLVPNLKDHVYMKDLISVKLQDSEELLEYLEYSGIKDVETIESEENLLVRVGENDYESAVTYLNVFIHEHMEETNEEDYYFDEYTTETIDVETKVSDMKSTVYTFAGVGGLAVVVGILNFIDVVQIKGFDKMMVSSVLILMGLIFVYVAFHTQKGIIVTKEVGGTKEEIIQSMVTRYFEVHKLEDLFSDSTINREDFDEGAHYFAVYDVIKNQVKILFPDKEDILINTACERIYDQMNEERNL